MTFSWAARLVRGLSVPLGHMNGIHRSIPVKAFSLQFFACVGRYWLQYYTWAIESCPCEKQPSWTHFSPELISNTENVTFGTGVSYLCWCLGCQKRGRERICTSSPFRCLFFKNFSQGLPKLIRWPIQSLECHAAILAPLKNLLTWCGAASLDLHSA